MTQDGRVNTENVKHPYMPYIRVPTFPPSEHHDAYFYFTYFGSVDGRGGGLRHLSARYIRGHFPKSQLLAVHQALHWIRYGWAFPINGITKFIGSSSGVCTPIQDLTTLTVETLLRYNTNFQSSWSSLHVTLLNRQHWALQAVGI